jgi:UDP-glucose 4-epimerase
LTDEGRVAPIAITGATGYVGGRLVKQFEATGGAPVRVLARDPDAGPEIVVGDLEADDDVLDRLCQGAGALVHLAGPNEVRAAEDPLESVGGLPAGTLRLAQAAARCGVRRVVYVSTVHVYGERLQPGEVVTEETPCAPRAAYAIARLAAEHVLAGFGPPDLVVLRVTNCVGAPAKASVDRWTLVANDLCRQGAVEGELRLHSDGTQWRDFVPLDDVVRIVATAAAHPGSLPPGTYNVGSGRPLTVRALAGMVQDAFEAAGCHRPPLHAPAPAANPPLPALVSVERLASAGYAVAGRIEDAVAETVAFCLAHREELSAGQR